MMYRVLTTAHLLRRTDGVFLHQQPYDVTLVVVGVGGTGGYLAEYAAQRAYAARAMYAHPERAGWAARVYLFDPDTVEARNVARQNFDPGDVGRPKVEAVAARLLRRFGGAGLRVSGNPVRFSRRHLSTIRREGSAQVWVLGCVDSSAGRAELAAAFADSRSRSHGGGGWPEAGCWYLDCGNGLTTGQVMLGNAGRARQLAGTFSPRAGTAAALPIPSWYEPALLAPDRPDHAAVEAEAFRRLGCAPALELGFQDPGINGLLAQVAANLLYQGLLGRLGVMGARVDLDTSEVAPIWIEPSVIAERCDMPKELLFAGEDAEVMVAAD